MTTKKILELKPVQLKKAKKISRELLDNWDKAAKEIKKLMHKAILEAIWLEPQSIIPRLSDIDK